MRLLSAVPAAALLLVPVAAVPAAAADGPVLAAAQPDGVVLLDPVTGARRALAVPDALEPAVSPDGTRLAFVQREGSAAQLWSSALDGSDRRLLLGGPATTSAPDWSPDGTRLVVTRRATAGGPSYLAVVPADGSAARKVPGTDGATVASWSPDSALLSVAARSGPYVTDPDGLQQQRLPAAGDWSPDGRSLLLTRTAADGSSDVARYDLATGAAEALTEFAGYHVFWERAVSAADGSFYTDISTESFPDDTGGTTTGSTVEHRADDGTYRPAFRAADRTRGAAPQAAGPLPRDGVVPAAVAATATAGPGRLDVEVARGPEPDAAGAVVRFAQGEVAPLTPADGLPAGRVLPGRLRLTGLPPRTTYSVSVFPRDWSGETGHRTVLRATTPPEEPTALQVSATPEPVPHGGEVSVRGVLTRNGRPFAGAPVELYGHRSGQPDALLFRSTTDDAGRVVVPRIPSAHTRYTLRYAGSGDVLPSSGSVLVHVRAVLRATVDRTTVPRGGAASVRVQVQPATPGGVVELYQASQSRTVARTRGRQDRYGVVRLKVVTSVRGPQHLVARATAPEHVEGTATSSLTVREPA